MAGGIVHALTEMGCKSPCRLGIPVIFSLRADAPARRSVIADQPITRLLQQWNEGDENALDALTPLVYDELRRLARGMFASESAGHTLQPTALVNEAFSNLVRAELSINDRSHFFALCARMMRRILVNHAKARRAAKRGGGATHLSFDENIATGSEKGLDILALDDAIQELAEADERKAKLVELHYFGGLTYDELSAAMSLSTSQVHRDLRTAKAWLKVRLAE